MIWLGQSALRINSAGGKLIVTDPWLRTNPITPPAYKDLAAFGRIDVLLVSHGHFDLIPLHYRTNPLANCTAKAFTEAMGSQSGVRVIIATPGQALAF